MKKVLFASLIAVTAIILSGWMRAQTTPTACGSANIVIESPQPNQVLSASFPLRARTFSNQGVTGVQFRLGANIIGSASPSQTDPALWLMPWNTASVPNGTYSLTAASHYNSLTAGSYDCFSQAVAITVQNNSVASPILVTTIAPTTWEGPTNIATNFTAAAYLYYSNGSKSDVTAATNFSWTTTIGTIESSRDQAKYYTGPRGGTGTINIVASYNGQNSSSHTNLTIHEQSSIGTTTNSTSTSAGTAGTTATPPIAKPLEPSVALCLNTALGEQRFISINNRTSAPTPAERLLGSACFKPSYIIPAILAPIDPAKLRDLAEDKITFSSLSAKTKNTESQGKPNKNVLVLSGRTLPNKTIFIYIFSEPLVLRAETDGNGNYSYVLENPLAPGKHQVYVAMEKDVSKFVRSAPLLIDVARAANSEQNPQGNSLELASSRPAQARYIAIAAILMIASLRMVFYIRKLLRLKKA